ncbi:uncharacterized protein LOC135366199 [Ornithodoros turicata]|uniref:uncharacterized protein LOC135366199 n=1 Tax=Ornithodoros turicata TaxID=34597 RepID=UPI0031386E98
MKTTFAVLLLGLAATAYSHAIGLATEAREDLRKSLGAALENVGRRFQDKQPIELPAEEKEFEDALFDQLVHVPQTLEEEALAQLVGSTDTEYGWLKKKLKKLKKIAGKITGHISKGPHKNNDGRIVVQP